MRKMDETASAISSGHKGEKIAWRSEESTSAISSLLKFRGELAFLRKPVSDRRRRRYGSPAPLLGILPRYFITPRQNEENGLPRPED